MLLILEPFDWNLVSLLLSCVVTYFGDLLLQLKVIGTPIKAAPQPVVERFVATSSPSPAPAPVPAPVSSAPEEALEKSAPVENEGQSAKIICCVCVCVCVKSLCFERIIKD